VVHKRFSGERKSEVVDDGVGSPVLVTAICAISEELSANATPDILWQTE
jgi:hypothetical protein